MINTNYNTSISFQGKSFRADRYAEDFVDAAVEEIKKKALKAGAEFQRAYQSVTITPRVKLQRMEYGYRGENSTVLTKYKGPKEGLSTEGGGYGGGWLKADLNTPLSTKDIHTCAAVHLANDNEHFLLHVYHSTKAEDLRGFIQEKFPRFNRVNIVPGDMLETNRTVNEILAAVTPLNPKVKPNFYHFASHDPEIVAHKGELSYIETYKNAINKMSFEEVKEQYFYGA